MDGLHGAVLLVELRTVGGAHVEKHGQNAHEAAVAVGIGFVGAAFLDVFRRFAALNRRICREAHVEDDAGGGVGVVVQPLDEVMHHVGVAEWLGQGVQRC